MASRLGLEGGEVRREPKKRPVQCVCREGLALCLFWEEVFAPS